ncbi:MAG: ribonuclease HII [Coriobacteriia bacterium]|nr:ribonuclease HII [Coriobacteriia bacterium]
MDTRSIAVITAELDSADDNSLAQLIASLAYDERAGVRRAVVRAQRRRSAEAVELSRLHVLARMEQELMDNGCVIVAGVDEVGRGALAGPVTACACVFDRDVHVPGVNDSKRLSPRTREHLAVEIRRLARGVGVAHVPPAEIDELGIVAATVEAMRQAIGRLPEVPDHVLVDGLPVNLGLACTAIVSGDALTRAIGAASIVAKVDRDRLMTDIDARFPVYGFAGNKGYGSAAHMEALRTYGPSTVHRLSFAPCSSRTLF